jgi:hypothetical protein
VPIAHRFASTGAAEMGNMKTTMKAAIAVVLLALATGAALSAQDKDSVKVEGGLGFAEFRGYEQWETINVSQSGPLIAVILGNETMIDAYRAGYPGNGKPFPDGAMMAKIHWLATKNQNAPGLPTVGGAQHDVDFMVKDSKRFPDGGWGYAMFKYDAATRSFRPGTLTDTPSQGNDANCGVACHSVAKKRDSVFTEYVTK